MSKICVGIVKDLYGISRESVVSLLFNIASEYELHVRILCKKTEPFLMHYDNNMLVFSLSDNAMYDNCDFLLLPDNCLYGGQSNPESFLQRASRLSCFFGEIVNRGLKSELFIGVSGTAYDEFEEVNVLASNLKDVLVSKANQYERDPELHIFLEHRNKNRTGNTRGRFSCVDRNTGDGSLC